MATLPPDSRIRFQGHLSAAKQAEQKAVSRSRSNKDTHRWNNEWLSFCAELKLDPYLKNFKDKVPLLETFGARVRDGTSARLGKSVRAGTVDEYLLSVAKGFKSVGARDPRLDSDGNIDYRLATFKKGMLNVDPPPDRVKPTPIQLLHHAQDSANLAPSDGRSATMDMTWVGYFYLLRPGEHCHGSDHQRNSATGERHLPLTLQDIRFQDANGTYDPTTCPVDVLSTVTYSSVTFRFQKNGQKGETLAQGTSGDPVACPTRALARRCNYLRSHNAPPDTPLCAYRHNGRWLYVTSELITRRLKTSLMFLPQLGIEAKDITARSLRAGGAMALLCGKIDKNIIELIGRWRSDAMLRYLHAQALPLVQPLAATMLQFGNFTMAPGAILPQPALQLLAENPLPSTDL